jgi:hypothetical protein
MYFMVNSPSDHMYITLKACNKISKLTVTIVVKFINPIPMDVRRIAVTK